MSENEKRICLYLQMCHLKLCIFLFSNIYVLQKKTIVILKLTNAKNNSKNIQQIKSFFFIKYEFQKQETVKPKTLRESLS